MSLDKTKKILSLIAIIITSFTLMGCVQVEKIKFIQRYVPGSSAQEDTYDYGVNKEGQVLTNQEIEVKMELKATQTITEETYLFFSVAVPKEFIPQDNNPDFLAPSETGTSIFKLKPYAGIPAPTSTIPNDYKWVTYAVFRDSETTPTNKATYNKNQMFYAKLIFNVGNKAQTYLMSQDIATSYLRQVASNTKNPTTLDWKGVIFSTNASNKSLTIFDSFTQLSSRTDDKYYIVKQDSTTTTPLLDELKGFYIEQGKVLVVNDSDKQLQVKADDIIVYGIIEASGRGYKGGQTGGIGNIGGEEEDWILPSHFNDHKLENKFNGTKGDNGEKGDDNTASLKGLGGNGGSKGLLQEGIGGNSGTNGLSGNAGQVNYLSLEETVSAGHGGGSGGGGGGGGTALFYPKTALSDTEYPFMYYGGGKGGNGGKGGDGGGAILLSGKTVTIGQYARILAKGTSGQEGSYGTNGKSSLKSFYDKQYNGGDSTNVVTEFDSETGYIYGKAENGYPATHHLTTSPYTYSGPWNTLPVYFEGSITLSNGNNLTGESNSIKFNDSDDFLIIKTAYDLKNISFYIKGNAGSVPDFQDELYISYSSDGINYSIEKYYGYSWWTPIPTTTTKIILNNIKEETRYIKFHTKKGTDTNENILIDGLTITKRTGYGLDGGGGAGGRGGDGGAGTGGSVLIKATNANGLSLATGAEINVESNYTLNGLNDGEIAFIAPNTNPTFDPTKIKTHNPIINYKLIKNTLTYPNDSTSIKWGENIIITWTIENGSIKTIYANGEYETQETTLTPKKYRFSFSTDNGESWDDLFGNPVDEENDWSSSPLMIEKTWITSNISNPTSSNQVLVKVEVKDINNKVSEVISAPFTIDSEAPIIGNVTFPDGLENHAFLPITWSGVYDEVSRIKSIETAIYIDDQAKRQEPTYVNTNQISAQGTYNIDLSSLASGTYKIKLKTTDTLDNSSIFTANDYLRDIDAPSVEVTFIATQETYFPEFTIEANEQYGKIKSLSLVLVRHNIPTSETLVTEDEEKTSYSKTNYTFPQKVENNATYSVRTVAEDTFGNKTTKIHGTLFIKDQIPAINIKEFTFDEIQNSAYPIFEAIDIEGTYSKLKSLKLHLTTKINGQEFNWTDELITPEAQTSINKSNYEFTKSLPNNKTYTVYIEAEDEMGYSIKSKMGTIKIQSIEPAITIEAISPLSNDFTSPTPTFDWDPIVPEDFDAPKVYLLFVYPTLADAQAGTNPINGYVYDLNKNDDTDPANDVDEKLIYSLPYSPNAPAYPNGTYFFKVMATGPYWLQVNKIQEFTVKADLPSIMAQPKQVPSGVIHESCFNVTGVDNKVGIDTLKAEIFYGSGHKDDDHNEISAGTSTGREKIEPGDDDTFDKLASIESWTQTFNYDENGEYTYTLTLTDKVGNVNTEQGTFIIDTIKPLIIPIGAIKNDADEIYYNKDNIKIEASIKDTHLSLLNVTIGEDTIEGAINTPIYNYEKTYQLTDGTYPVTIEAKDIIGINDKLDEDTIKVHTTTFKKTITIDTVKPVISEIKVEDNIVQPNATITVSTLTPYIKITIDDVNKKDIFAIVTPVNGGNKITLGTDDLNNSSADFNGDDNKLQNSQAYEVIIEAKDKATNTATPVAFYINVIQGKVPTNLTIEKVKVSPDNDNDFFTNDYSLSWSCDALAEGESFEILTSNNPSDDFHPITDKDSVYNDKAATIGLTSPANNTTHYIQVEVKNMDGSYSLPSNNVLIKSIVLSNTSTNNIIYPVNDNRYLNKLAEEIQYSNLNGYPYTYTEDNPDSCPEMLDLISITHVATNKTYQMYYLGKDDGWYKDSSLNMPEVKINDQIKVNVSKQLNWIIVGEVQ